LYNRYGKKQIWFSDDTFTSNKVFADKLMDALTDLGGIEWSCLTRVNTVDSNLLTKMKRAGCKYISYGVESADPDMLNDMNKGITMDTVREAITNTKQSGLDMYLFFIVGYPGDTEEKVERDFDLVREICPTGVGFNIFVPLPGSKIWDELVSTGKLEPSAMNWDHLFARVGYNEYDDYSANLDEQWCSITSKKIVELCKYGESLCSI
jgi:anaerobic magnesium-protoporphyrin IX monomethyl ester cyclase